MILKIKYLSTAMVVLGIATSTVWGLTSQVENITTASQEPGWPAPGFESQEPGWPTPPLA
ncbi:hypothetical protein EDC32_10125 [Laceyella sacchari]|jgi:hypothetical protein|nr:hypothetical protein EDC32_10125 [Laceyella sacchari]